MNELVYILLGFFGGVVFSIWLIVCAVKSVVIKIGKQTNETNDK